MNITKWKKPIWIGYVQLCDIPTLIDIRFHDSNSVQLCDIKGKTMEAMKRSVVISVGGGRDE